VATKNGKHRHELLTCRPGMQKDEAIPYGTRRSTGGRNTQMAVAACVNERLGALLVNRLAPDLTMLRASGNDAFNDLVHDGTSSFVGRES